MKNETCRTSQITDSQVLTADYFPMQNNKYTDNLFVARYVVQMWFKSYVNNLHVAGTKNGLEYSSVKSSGTYPSPTLKVRITAEVCSVCRFRKKW